LALTDISAISGYAGKFYPQIIRRIFANLDIVKDVNLLRNVTAPRNLWGFNVTDGLRPLDINIEDTNKSNGSFTNRKITPEIVMRILKIIPEELRDTFFSEVLSENAKDLPAEFAEYFWNEIGKSIAAEINNNVYFGVSASTIADFNPAIVYTAGQRMKYKTTEGMEYFQAAQTTIAGDTPISAPSKWTNINNKCLAQGFGTIIAKEITDGKFLNVTSTGAITQADALTQIDGAMWSGIPDEVKAAGVTFLMSQATYDKRVKKLRALKEAGSSFTDSEFENSKREILDSEGKGIIKPVTWMRGSGRVIWTIDKNLVMGTNQLPGANPFGPFIPNLQSYKTIMKLILCFQIADLRYAGSNDIA
jgi:hypothetical protein